MKLDNIRNYWKQYTIFPNQRILLIAKVDTAS